MKRTLCLIFTMLLLLSAALPVFSMGTESYVQLVHITVGKSYDIQTTVHYETLQEAVRNAADGDVIEIFDDVTVSSPITVPSGIELTVVSGTKRENTALFGRSIFEYTDMNASPKTVKKNFDGSLFTVSENSNVTFMNVILDGNSKGGSRGGLIYAGNGAGITLKKGDSKSAVSLQNSKLGDDSLGGAIYAEKGAAIKVEDAVFSGNTAVTGKDIYAEQKSDVTAASGIKADIAFPMEEIGVEINGLNLILSDKIGLTFHTVVPDKYSDGKFVLTCRTGKKVTYKISDCPKDKDGRYMAKYAVSPLELSEQVTLTVYDKDGKSLASKKKSVEDYGKVILESKSASAKEKKAVSALLNYGFYAQVACSDYNGWSIGKNYAKTAKSADLTVKDTALKAYNYTWTGSDEGVGKILAELSLDAGASVNLFFPSSEKPTVTVNGKKAEVVSEKLNGCGYKVFVEGIGVLDYDKEITVTVNGRITLEFTVLTYCRLAMEQGSSKCANAAKALYEYYKAVSECK